MKSILFFLISFIAPKTTCEYCHEKMSKRQYEYHFCAEKYKAFSIEAAKTTGGTVHSVRKLVPGKGWIEI